MRSTVIQPPPPKRLRSAVVKPPRKKDRRVLDPTLGVIGAALLVLTIALFYVLPDEDVVLPLYEVDFEKIHYNFTTVSAEFTENSREQEFVYEIPVENAFFFNVRIGLQDDNPASDPEVFAIRLYDHLGRQIGVDAEISTPAPRFDAEQNQYVADYAQARSSFQQGGMPEDAFWRAASPDETADVVRSQLLEDYLIESKGNWTLRVTLKEAGDCPPLNGPDPQRAVMCRQIAPDGVDAGNSLLVEQLEYTYFDVNVLRVS